MAKKVEITDLTPVELAAKSREMRQELFNLRLQQATSRLEKPHRMRELRRQIARCETRLNTLRNQNAPAKKT